MKKLYCLLSFALLCAAPSFAQEMGSNSGKKNILKYNISGALLKMHTFQLERVINRKQSFAVAVGLSGNAGLPFKNRLIELYGNDTQARNAIESSTFNKFTITPEYRFYLSGKAPKGLYVAPFARYANMKINQTYSFVDSDNTTHNTLLDGKITGFGGGILLGAQWTLGRSFVLDLWLAGPFYGVQKAEFTGTDDRKILNTGGLKADIESIDLPLWTVKANVSNQVINGVERGVVNATVDGPFVGLRGLGLSFGFRF